MNVALSKFVEQAGRISSSHLKEAIKEMMVEKLMLKISKGEILDETPLFGPDGLGLDSIDALELVVSLEKQFGVVIRNANTAKIALATVNSIHDYILDPQENAKILEVEVPLHARGMGA